MLNTCGRLSINSSYARYLLASLLILLLQACGGSSITGSHASVSSTSVYGVAATGLAINGVVTLKDATGVTVTANIAQPSGEFNIDVTGLTSPYFLKATDNTGTITLYSVATGVGNFNINPLTNLAVVAAAMGMDPLARTPDTVFNNPAKFASLTPAQLQAAMNKVMGKMSPAFKAALAANGADTINPMTDAFQVGNGLDKVFDNFVITLNTATEEIQEQNVASNAKITLGLVDMLGTFPAAGVYDGSVNIPGAVHPVSDVLITADGEMRFVLDNGVQVLATLTASGSTVTGTGKAYAPTLNGQTTGFQFIDGSTAINLTISGTLGTGTFTGTYSYGSNADTFSFTLNTQQTGNTASLSKIAGTYVSALGSNTTYIGHIETNGKIWGSGPGVAYSGVIQIVDLTANLYRVTLAYQQNGTYGFVSGLATFHDAAPATVTLSMPAVHAPADYTGDIANLSYSQSVSGNQGMFVMLLSSPAQQIFIDAVRMSSQLQTVAVQPTVNTLMIQAAATAPAFSVTSVDDTQYSASAAIIDVPGSMSFSVGGILNLNTNPGDIILSGYNSIILLISQTMLNQVVKLVSSSGTACSTTSTGSATPPPVGTLVISAIPACKTYDAIPYSGGNGVTYAGFLNGDTPAVLGGALTYGGTSQGVINVGTYTITPGGLTSSSYNIIYVDSTLTVNPATLTVSGNNTVKIYDGISTTTITGTLVGGESITLSNSITGSLTGGSLSITGLDATGAINYSLTGGTVTTGILSPMQIYDATITGSTTTTSNLVGLAP